MAFGAPGNPGRGDDNHPQTDVNDRVVSSRQINFDLDGDDTGTGDNRWAPSVHAISARDQGLSLDLQLTPLSTAVNNLGFCVIDQYDADVKIRR
ncbi:hypothetical protein [Hymenobacter algoricola]|uniref:Uncharacterized protein n=1 Tax=Hymenobacter algoricola TaxID=486267 RepID=A0ABP7NW21_9BACT